MNIVIRVDSSTLIGSGHLMRCLTLAQRHRYKGDTIHFICRDLPGNISALVEEQGFALYTLPQAEKNEIFDGYAKWLTVSQERDVAETVKVVQSLGTVDRLVVDHYAIDSDWEKRLRPFVKEIFVIDDLANRVHDCDYLLDQNYYVNKEFRYKGLVPEQCQLHLGPRYALLREEFYNIKKTHQRAVGQLHNILVFYGGVDNTNETSKAIRALHSLQENNALPGFNVTVLVGAGNAHQDQIAKSCTQAGFRYLCQVDNVAEQMVKADLMLGAGGTTTWERCYLELPSIVTAVAENQFKICEDCETAGLISYIGRWDKVDEKEICQAIEQMTDIKMRQTVIDKMRLLFVDVDN